MAEHADWLTHPFSLDWAVPHPLGCCLQLLPALLHFSCSSLLFCWPSSLWSSIKTSLLREKGGWGERGSSGGVSSSVLQCFFQHGKLAVYWRRGQCGTTEVLEKPTNLHFLCCSEDDPGRRGEFYLFSAHITTVLPLSHLTVFIHGLEKRDIRTNPLQM